MSKAPQFLYQDRLSASFTLLIPSRINEADLAPIEKLAGARKTLWLCEENVVLSPSVEAFLTKREAIAFSNQDTQLEGVGKKLREDAGEQGLVIFVTGETIAHSGTTVHISGETLEALAKLKLPFQGLGVHHPKELSLSIENESNLPSAIIALSESFNADQCSSAKIRQELINSYEEAFSSRTFLNGSLTYAALAGLKRNAKIEIIDGTNDQIKTYEVMLGAALAFSKVLKTMTEKKRIGIILPPGPGGLIANIAALFAGKTPVNINFTASKGAVESAIRQADVDKFITADPFVRKLPDFSWPPNRDLILIERILPTLRKSITRWVLLSRVTPTPLFAKLAGVKNVGGDQEAVLLFTSGSSGDPKGVPLTHRNILGNVCQFGTRLNLPDKAKILGSLPLFHSFGLTATLLYPIIEGLGLVTFPSPLDTKRIAELVEQHKIAMLLSTPTFLRGYMRRIAPEQLQPLQLVVTGAEKLPQSLALAFEKKFNIPPQEGYGLTETAPATNVNLPDLSSQGSKAPVINSTRLGTVGNFLPGIAVRMTDPSTNEELPINKAGIIWMRGPNVFSGYLNNQTKSDEVFDGKWFKTGDVGYICNDGFLTIEGRISRFSKIGGEMVPHEAVEAAVNQALGLDEETERKVAIVGLPDEKKGESIALLSIIAGEALEQECLDLRYRLLDKGIPSLWCPKQIIPVDQIPILASGKLDIKACADLALAAAD
ncbi:AMP-binding protein [Rubritalea marina]|uniref:AMP-binding protein n=1 Tax=Rubritalea marina TaxID=361055 RepID=UPI0003648000|nr:AMP-binding protein [Rubritalea marina]